MSDRETSDIRSDDGLDDLLDIGLRIHFGDDDTTSMVSGRSVGATEAWSGHPVIERLLLEGRYEPVETLGQGGMGFVIAVEDRLARRRVALKIARPFAIENRLKLAALFIDEARVAAGLDHPSIPAVYDVGVVDEVHPWFTMPIIVGRSLREILAETPEGASRTPLLAIVRRVAQAMSYAHSRGVIHGDLKPSNVMVTGDGEVYVVDWGLSRIDRHGSNAATSTKTPAEAIGIGTPSYMAPEQARGAVDLIGPRTDVFNLGAMLYEALTGQTPYSHVDSDRRREAAAKADLAPAIARLVGLREHADHAAIISRCLAFEPGDRPVDCTVVHAELARLERETNEAARRLTIELATTRVAVEHGRRVRRALWALVVTLVVGASFTVQWLRLRAQEDLERERRVSRIHELLTNAEAARSSTSDGDLDHRIDVMTRVAADLAAAVEIAAGEDSHEVSLARSDLASVSSEIEALRLRRDTELESRRQRARLAELRRACLEGRNKLELDRDFTELFSSLGIHPDESLEGAALALSTHSLRDELHAALGDWCLIRRGANDGAAAPASRLVALLDAVDGTTSSLSKILASPTLEGPDMAAALERLVETSLPSSLHLAAHDLLSSGRRDDARRLYEAALAEHPIDFWLNYGLGCLYFDEGQEKSMDRAIVHFVAATTSAPEEARAWASLGSALSRRSRHVEAERALLRALMIEPSNKWAHFSLAIVYKLLGRLPDALSELDAADVGGLHSPYWSRRHRAEILLQSGENAQALDVVEGARVVYPDDDALFGLEVRALRATGQKEKAFEVVDAYARRRQTSVLAYQELGRALEESSDRVGAENAYRRALALDPENDWTCRRLAALLSQRADPEQEPEIRILVEVALKWAPQNMESRHLRGLSNERAGRVAEALRDYRAALDVAPPGSTGHAILERHVVRAEELVRLEGRMNDVLRGDVHPESRDDWRQLIAFASQHRLWRREAALRRAMILSRPSSSNESFGSDDASLAMCLIRSLSPTCNDRGEPTDAEVERRLIEAADALDRGIATLESALSNGDLAEDAALVLARRWLTNSDLAALRPSAVQVDPKPYARPTTWTRIEALLPDTFSR